MCLQYKSLENIVGKGEIARNEQFPLFPKCFLLLFAIFIKSVIVILQTLSVWKSKKFDIWERVKT